MIRLLSFTVQIALLVALALWLADQPGSARIVWHDTVIETSAAFLAVCVLGIGYGLHLLLRLWHFLRNGPVLWRLNRRIGKMQAGEDNLTRGLVALAAGNAPEAGRLAVAARKTLGNVAAAQWLQAQAALLAGDRRAAQELFRTLAAQDDTAVLGYRGLINQARRAGQWDEVDRLVQDLHKVKPATPWLSLVRMESAARRGLWIEAESSLAHAAAGLLESATGKKTRAALRLAASREAAAAGDSAAALRAAEEAAQYYPDWTPAAINLASALAASGHNRAARRTIERAWKQAPHPDLAALVRRLEDNPLDAFRAVERLTRGSETRAESCLALAEAALAADIWGEARRVLTGLVKAGGATQKAYRLLAALERRDRHDERAATAWLAKAPEAPADPVWLCAACGGAHEAWQPTCAHCGSFNSIEWLAPGQRRTSPVLALADFGGMHD